MPDVDSILRTVAQWKYIIKSDLTTAFILVSRTILFISYIVSDKRAFLRATREARSAKVFISLYELWFLRVV
jgi:hypothetical protein